MRMQLCSILAVQAAVLSGGWEGFYASSIAQAGQEAFKWAASYPDVDRFGHSIAIDNSIAVIGSPFDRDPVSPAGAYLFDTTNGQLISELVAVNSNSQEGIGWSVGISGHTAIVGAPFDSHSGLSAGAAHIFDATTGQQLFTLFASDADTGDQFGWAVAVSGNVAVVGAHQNSGNSRSGAAYLFDVSTGQQLHKLTAPDFGADDFGYSVAISGNTAIVGARFDEHAGIASGSAYLFDVTTGEPLRKLVAADAAVNQNFGQTVAISGSTVVVGSHSGSSFGSGYAYVFDVSTGEQLYKFVATDSQPDAFGSSVSVSENIALIGASGRDDHGDNSGAAYLFDVTTGYELAKLTASDLGVHDVFGFSVAISGKTAVIGSPGDRDTRYLQPGAAYAFLIVPEPTCFGLLVCSLTAIHFIVRKRAKSYQA